MKQIGCFIILDNPQNNLDRLLGLWREHFNQQSMGVLWLPFLCPLATSPPRPGPQIWPYSISLFHARSFCSYGLPNLYVSSSVLPNLYVCSYVLPNWYMHLYVLQNSYVRSYVLWNFYVHLYVIKTRHVTCDRGHMTCDMWHWTPDTWQVWGGEPSLKISAPQLLPFGNEGLLKIYRVMRIFPQSTQNKLNN